MILIIHGMMAFLLKVMLMKIKLRDAVANLIKVKGRHNTEVAYQKLIEAFDAPKREWVGLTNEEILEEYRQSYGDDGDLTDVYFARAIESKLKEKNNG